MLFLLLSYSLRISITSLKISSHITSFKISTLQKTRKIKEKKVPFVLAVSEKHCTFASQSGSNESQ